MVELIWGIGTVNFHPVKLPRKPQLDKVTHEQKKDKKSGRPLWKPNRFRITYTYPLPTPNGTRPRKVAEGTTKEVKDRLAYLLPDESLLTLDKIKRMAAGIVLMRERATKQTAKLAVLQAEFDAWLKVNPETSLEKLEMERDKLYASINATPAPDLAVDDSDDPDAGDTETDFEFEANETSETSETSDDPTA